MAKSGQEFAMKIVEIVGANIANRRRQLNISQKELAARLDITQDAMNRIERGRMAPKMSRLESIAEELKCPVSFLFRNPDDKNLETAGAIAEILAPLPSEGQQALLNLVADAARVMKGEHVC
ncbi:MAG: helix-turn-helix transcriptional regulator [Desulfovibrio sp.]|nr:helix-turn-helix transcriptional regulator [Desulfovibrio sp.]